MIFYIVFQNCLINFCFSFFFHQGLAQLYDFKLQYPEADIYVQPFLLKSHQFFQDYIEQGLKDIDKARKGKTLISPQNNQYVSGKFGSSQFRFSKFTLKHKFHFQLTDVSGAPRSLAEEKTMMDPMSRLERLRNLEAQCKPTAPSHSNQT